MVPQRPFLIGNPGCVRSNAWIWLFSSTQSTIACCGGLRYKPTTSVNFSRNLGSRESLKVFTRCGLRLWLRQMLLTVDLLTPWFLAMSRQLHCVIPLGLVCKVASTSALILSAPYTGLRPRPGAISHRLSRPCSAKRRRHKITVLRLICNCAAMALSDWPFPAASTIRPRSATCWGVPWAANHFSICCRSPTSKHRAAIIRGMTELKLEFVHMSSYFLDTTLDVPSSTLTNAFGVNAAGQIVGIYRDANDVYHGFLDSGGTF